jgi:hypothetical protein
VILDDLKGEVVFIKLRDYEQLVTFGVSSVNVYAKIVEVDERVGVWVENPNWSPGSGEEEDTSHLAHILVRWEYIVGIMTFPEREGFEEEEDIKPIGFAS